MYEGSFKKYISFYATKHFVLFFRNISFCGLYPADNDIFVGTYKGRITYLDGNVHKAADNGSVTVVKAGGSYYFRFSDGIPNLKGVKFKKEGDHTLVNIDFKEGVTFIRINASTLNILYTMDGKIWTANAKR